MEFTLEIHPRPTPELLTRLAGYGLLGEPGLWDALEQGNPAPKEYRFLECGDEWAFCALYPLRLNLLTFAGRRLGWPITLAAIPCSVSGQGFCVSSSAAREALFRHLRTLPGGVLVLNTDDCPPVPGFVRGRTLPTCVLRVRWSSFADYWKSLRSPYRRRLRLAREALAGLEIRDLDPVNFSPAHYRLYEQVYQKSDFPLEKLAPDFFRRLPAQLVEFRMDGAPAGFIQLLRQGGTLWFLFCGMAEDFPRRVDLYHVMLTEIVRRGIDGGFQTIDLGQTTEETKLRFGAELQEKWFYARHSRPLVQLLLRAGRGLLEYQETPPVHHPFQEGL